MISAHVFTHNPSPALFPTMLTQAVTKRRKDCSVLLFIAFILVWEAVVSLPGFLYFYFWEGAGLPFSAFIGFLIGNFVLSVLEALDQVVGAVRWLFRGPERSKAAKTKSNHGGEDAQA